MILIHANSLTFQEGSAACVIFVEITEGLVGVLSFLQKMENPGSWRVGGL